MDKNHARKLFNCNGSQPVLGVLGGSQGSASLNHHFKQQYKNYTDSNIKILWQCGKTDYELLKKTINVENVHLIPFLDDMGAFYSAVDLIVSRAGALTLSEIALMGKAMVLVPFPYSAGDHQMKNAQVFAKSGAAILLSESNLDSGEMEKSIIELFHQSEKISDMEERSKQMSTPGSTENIVSVIMEVAKI